RGNLVGSADHDRRPELVAFLYRVGELLCHGLVGAGGAEDDVAALKQRSDVAEAGLLADDFQIRHAEDAGAADVYGAKQHNEAAHRLPIQLTSRSVAVRIWPASRAKHRRM